MIELKDALAVAQDYESGDFLNNARDDVQNVAHNDAHNDVS